MELIGFTWVLRENSVITKVNDINEFESLKLGGTIEWEQKIFNNLVIELKKWFHVGARQGKSLYLQRNLIKIIFSTVNNFPS